MTRVDIFKSPDDSCAELPEIPWRDTAVGVSEGHGNSNTGGDCSPPGLPGTRGARSQSSQAKAWAGFGCGWAMGVDMIINRE